MRMTMNGICGERAAQGTEGFGRNDHMPHAARLQRLQMLKGRIKQLMIGSGHGFMVTGPANRHEHFRTRRNA